MNCEVKFPDRSEPVMKYMGDQPSKQHSRVGNELTDEIFEPALKHVCQTLASFSVVFSVDR